MCGGGVLVELMCVLCVEVRVLGEEEEEVVWLECLEVCEVQREEDVRKEGKGEDVLRRSPGLKDQCSWRGDTEGGGGCVSRVVVSVDGRKCCLSVRVFVVWKRKGEGFGRREAVGSLQGRLPVQCSVLGIFGVICVLGLWR